MLSGHRRKKVYEILGLEEIDAIIKDLNDDESTIFMVDSNMYREKLLPSEKAFAYRMKMEATIKIENNIDKMFMEISTRNARFENMTIDEKIKEIANLIENMLKQDGKFITPEYEKVCCGFIDDTIVKNYRKQMQCFRHCTDEAIAERKTYSEEQKTFLVDYGLTIVKAIHELIK